MITDNKIQFVTDPEVKEAAHRIAKQMGLSLSAVLNIYLHEFVRTQELHVSLNQTLRTELQAAHDSIARGEGLSAAEVREKLNLK